jgi:hypothetical protein
VESATKDKEYTSPVPKLARFFEKSRDQWKAKCREAKRMLKRQRGLYHGVHRELEAHLKPLAATEQAQQVMAELVAFVAQEAAKARHGERLLGSSESIESVLGKQKHLEQDQAKNGFAGFLLALCASVADTTTDVVRQALETVPTKKVLAWCRENLGQSVQAQRRTAFPSRGRKEQKWNQSWTPV